MSTNDIDINEDKENDVLYVIKREYKGKHTTNLGSANPNFTIRVDLKTRMVVGFTIENFSKIMPQIAGYGEYMQMEYFDSLIEIANATHLVPNQI